MRQITVFRATSAGPIPENYFNRIDELSDNNFLFTVIDTNDVNGRQGWFVSEQVSETVLNVYRSIPLTASLDAVIKLLQNIKAGTIGPDAPGNPGPDGSRPENILLDLDGTGKEYRGLFPIIRIANAPAWLVNLLNTLAGHGALSLYIWLAITGLVGGRMALNKKRSALCWLILAFCAKMTWDAYQYKKQSTDEQQ